MYRCRHCLENYKRFALGLRQINGISGDVFKMGEQPEFGRPIPKEVKKLLGKQYNLFRKGYSAEKEGKGIGAFAYYRRVVDEQKDHLCDEIIKVLK